MNFKKKESSKHRGKIQSYELQSDNKNHMQRIRDFIYFCGTGIWTQELHLEQLYQPCFVMGFSETGSHGTICWVWLWTMILLISVSWVARITGRSHWPPTKFEFCNSLVEVIRQQKKTFKFQGKMIFPYLAKSCHQRGEKESLLNTQVIKRPKTSPSRLNQEHWELQKKIKSLDYIICLNARRQIFTSTGEFKDQSWTVTIKQNFTWEI
jgi:hypothetical protein